LTEKEYFITHQLSADYWLLYASKLLHTKETPLAIYIALRLAWLLT
jgi:hypothetical protein